MTGRGAASGLGLAAILAAGAFLRLRDGDLTWFFLDQARDLSRALDIVQGRAWPLVGPEVQGSAAHTWGPLYFYVLAVPLAWSPRPLAAVTFLALLNLLGVYVAYRLGRRFFGPGAGLLAAALLATAPFAVLSGRALWNLAPLPLLSGIFLYGLLAVVVEGRSRMLVPAMAALGAMLQLHLSSVAALAALVLALAIYRPPLPRRHLAAGAAALAVLLLPYAWAQARDGFRSVRATLAYSGTDVGPARLGEALPSVRQAFLASSDLTRWLRQAFGDSPAGPAATAVQQVVGVVLLAGAAYVAARALAGWRLRRRGSAAAAYGVLALYIWTPIALLLFKRGLRSLHYLDVLYPATFLAAALLLRDLLAPAAARLREGRRALVPAAVLAGAVAVVALAHGYTLDRLRGLTLSAGAMPLPARILSGDPMAGSPAVWLMPIRYRERLVRALVERTGPSPDAFYRHVHGAAFGELIEDSGFFFEARSRRERQGAAPLPGSAAHLAVLRPDLAARLGAPSGGRRVGPFTLVEYAPRLDPAAWTYTTPARLEGGPDAWTPVPMPTHRIPHPSVYEEPPLFRWPAPPLLLRGEVVTGEPPGALALVVALRQWHAAGHRVEECRVGEVVVRGQPGSRYWTVVAERSETTFDLTRHLRPGRNVVTCRIDGGDGRLDVDVYELPGGVTAGG